MQERSGQSPAGLIHLTACQIRMARAALRWDVRRLQQESGVSERTIRRVESVYGVPSVHTDTLMKLRLAFERQGFVFIPEDGSPDGPGLRWGRYPGRTVADRTDRS